MSEGAWTGVYQLWRCSRCLAPRVWGRGRPGEPGEQLQGEAWLVCDGCDGEVRFQGRRIRVHTLHRFWKYAHLPPGGSLQERLQTRGYTPALLPREADLPREDDLED